MKASIARRRLGAGERIQVEAGAGGQPPASFTWRRRRYQIGWIEGRGERPTVSEGTVRAQRWYNIRTVDGMRVQLLHDVQQDRWRMGAVLGHEGG